MSSKVDEERPKLEGVEEERHRWANIEIEVEALPSHVAGQGLQDG